MTKIVDFLRQKGILPSTDLGPAIVQLFAQDGVRVEVLYYLLECGHAGYGVRAEYYIAERGEWITIAELRDFNLQQFATLIQLAAKYVAQSEDDSCRKRVAA